MNQDENKTKEPIVVDSDTVIFGFIAVVFVAFAGFVIGSHFGNI